MRRRRGRLACVEHPQESLSGVFSLCHNYLLFFGALEFGQGRWNELVLLPTAGVVTPRPIDG